MYKGVLYISRTPQFWEHPSLGLRKGKQVFLPHERILGDLLLRPCSGLRARRHLAEFSV